MSRVRQRECPTCQGQTRYSEKWDAYYCPACNAWTSPRCSCTADSPPGECMYHCWERPERPLKRAARREKGEPIKEEAVQS